MYICICNAIRATELREAATNLRGDAEEIYTALGRPPQCRQCLEEAEEIISETRNGGKLPTLMHH